MNISLGAIIQHIASSFCYFIIFLNYIFIEYMFLLSFFYNLNHILEIFTLILTLYFITDCFVHINYHAIFLFFLSLSLGIFFFQFFIFFDDYDEESEDIYFLGCHDSFFILLHFVCLCSDLLFILI